MKKLRILFVTLVFWAPSIAGAMCLKALDSPVHGYSSKLVAVLPDSYLNQRYLLLNIYNETIPVRLESEAFSTRLFPEIFNQETHIENAVLVSYLPRVLKKKSELPKQGKRIFLVVSQDALEFHNYSQKIVVGNNLVGYFKQSRVLGPELSEAKKIADDLKMLEMGDDHSIISDMNLSFLKKSQKKLNSQKVADLRFLSHLDHEISRRFPSSTPPSDSIKSVRLRTTDTAASVLDTFPTDTLKFCLENGFGACEQRSVLAALVFEQLELPYQILTASPLDKSGEFIGLHAANVVRLPGGAYYFDASIHLIFPFDERSFSKRLNVEIDRDTVLSRINLTSNFLDSDKTRVKDWYQPTSFYSRLKDVTKRESIVFTRKFLTEEEGQMLLSKLNEKPYL